MKSLFGGLPVISWPPIVINRAYQSIVASEKSLSPMKLQPATSPVWRVSALE